jgi:adenosylhomocysteine nucleosidase
MKIGVVGAMRQEVQKLIAEMQVQKTTKQGKRTFYEGTLYGKEVVLVFSRWGKVAAATTATQLISDFHVDKMIFTGIAGALAPHLRVGDVVIGQRFFQHDMDASPMVPVYEIPLIGRAFFQSDEQDVALAKSVVTGFFNAQSVFLDKLRAFGISNPTVYVGDIASGDLFVSSQAQKDKILKGLPSTLCVEMEGAAVAQVCFDFDIPLLVIRSISDTADHQAEIDFPVFLDQIASEYAHYVLKDLLPKM